ncbi:MAG: hypothetical protein AB1665_01445 [Candidatus Thermoplasmatota archaeon]
MPLDGDELSVENKLAPHVEELARALGEGADKEGIERLLKEYLGLKLKIEEAKRMAMRELNPQGDRGVDRKLEELGPSDPNVNITARVLYVTEREVEARGERKRIYSGILGDETTTRQFTAWNADAVPLAKGDVIRIESAYTTEWRGEPQVNIGTRARVVRMPPDALPAARRRSEECLIADLRDGMSGVAVSGRVISMEEREVVVGEEKKIVRSGVIADPSSKVMFSAWHDFGITQGDAIKVHGGYVRNWRGLLQLNFDERSRVERLEEFPSIEELSLPLMSSIRELEERGGAVDIEIHGIVLDVKEASGLIFRCPECNRVLKGSDCRVHGAVEGTPDMRIKAIVDDGTGALMVICTREATERLLGRKLDDWLKEIHGRKIVNYDVVRDHLVNVLVAKPVAVRGSVSSDDFGLSLTGTEMHILSVDVSEEARKILSEEEGGIPL